VRHPMGRRSLGPRRLFLRTAGRRRCAARAGPAGGGRSPAVRRRGLPQWHGRHGRGGLDQRTGCGAHRGMINVAIGRERTMGIQALGYLGIGTDKLDDWTNYATNWLGMQAVDRSAGSRAFRMDDRKQRLVIDRSLPDGQRYFGWEVADAASLDALATRLEAA